MMNNDQINQIFEQYADEQPQVDIALTQKAKAYMQKPRKKSANTWILLASVLCCLVVCFVSVSVFNNLFGSIVPNPDGDSSNNQGAAPPSSVVITNYNAKDAVGQTCQMSEIQGVNLQLVLDSYNVVSQKYLAYYVDNQLVCYKVTFGVVNDMGIAEVTILVELDGFVRNDLKDEYKQMSQTLSTFTAKTERGEYVTKAYLQAIGVHCYLQITGDVSNADQIATKIFS